MKHGKTKDGRTTLQPGDVVRLKAGGPGPNTGTVTRVTKFQVRVLFPIRHSMWVRKEMVEKVGE